MVQRPEAPKLFLKEWMEVRGIPDQARLAERMHRAPGTITKKLQRPGRIDVEWMAEFAQAFEIQVTDLFVDPSMLDETERLPHRPALELLLRAARNADDDQLSHLTALLPASPSSLPQPERPLELALAPPTSGKSDQRKRS
jgi:hypothetical protein